MKKLISCILVLMLIVGGFTSTEAVSESKVHITIDGNEVTLGEDLGRPYIDENNRVLVPLRGVMETFGAQVNWDSDNRIAVVEKDHVKVEVPVGQKYILKNGTRIENDTVAVIQRDISRVYLPIRIVLESFGAGVDWDSNSKTVIVNSKGNTQIPTDPENPSQQELRAMWISYLEFGSMPKEQASFQSTIDHMFDHCIELGMNAVIVQVRPDSDAMYASKYYPWSKFASGKQGVNPGYDPLAYMIEAAHKRNLQFHAWINPYRVTGYNMDWSEVSSNNPAKVWLTDNDPFNDRWVLKHQGFYYYNPSVPNVRELVVNGVSEIVKNYDVDGIHFDDYFYPSLNDKDQALCFDKPEYDLLSSTTSIANWRKNNINQLVQAVYSEVKMQKNDVIFGISPAGNVDSLKSNTSHFVDIDTWMTEDGYVDYIMPQLYWGFERKDSTGNIAPYAYENNLHTWINLKNKGNVKLYIGLNVANAGANIKDGNPTSEWLRYNDILKRQVAVARNSGEVSGFAFFRYGSFENTAAQAEVSNLINELKK